MWKRIGHVKTNTAYPHALSSPL
ncbi:unnamed protein product [Acanthoscelides obtectus]|uniref:Uncharacterized protein n=1 Tax=Acanthoscelides obtectus TaxID=200917 RepID=A0A9P0PQR0_ACAOB|nr:unnamed protein product [Acanthoscelides obtectus]CAK1671347.1 hypothetical protein AOBTE_LOCUS28228 [Acanthoscelides obtectus]